MAENNLNAIIPKLLSKSNNYTQGIKQRIRVHGIFNEFDQKANTQLRNFINESRKRYKGIKSGNHLETVLQNSRDKYSTIGERILTDNFYVKMNIEKEKKIMRKKTDTKNIKEVYDLMKKVRYLTNTLPFRERKEIEKEEKKKEVSPKKTKNNLNLMSRTAKFNENANILHDIIDKDENVIQNNIEDYKSYLDDLKENPTDKNSLTRPYGVYHLSDQLKMLNYTKAPIVKEVVKKVDDDNIEIKKLLKYSKLGEKIITLHLHDDEEKVTDYPPLGGIIDTKNYKDVISLVKTEANNGLYLDQVFDQKKAKLDMKLSCDLPQLEEYDNIVKGKMMKERVVRRRKIKRTTIKMDEALIEPEEKLRMDIINKRNKLRINNLFLTSKDVNEF